MCRHESLRYTWMRFLPGTISSDFWSNLEPVICQNLCTRSILEPFQDAASLSGSQELIPLCKPGLFHILPSSFLDKDKNPLFQPKSEIKYLSLAYSSEDRSRLKSIHVQQLDWSRILDLLEEDLKDSHSRWRSISYDTDWQIQVSKLLAKICSSEANKKRLRNLGVVKLLGGGWITPSSIDSLFLPTTGPADVPNDIGLSLIDPESIKISSRVSLMEELGAKHATPGMVIAKIELTHSKEHPYKTVYDGLVHFLYLFWHGPQTLPQSLKARLRLAREPNAWANLNMDLFLPLANDDLGPKKLFGKLSRRSVQADGFSDAFFLHN